MPELQSIRKRKQQRHNRDLARLLPGHIVYGPGGSLLPVAMHMRKMSGGHFLSCQAYEKMVR